MKKIIKNISSELNSNKLCSRRIMGIIGIISCIIAAYLSMFIYSITIDSYWEHILYTSAALLGLTTFDLFSKNKENNNKEE